MRGAVPDHGNRGGVTDFHIQRAMPFFLDPKKVWHTALKQVICRIIRIQIVKEFTKRLVRLTGVEHNRIADEIDIPAMKRPVKETLCDFGWTLM